MSVIPKGWAGAHNDKVTKTHTNKFSEPPPRLGDGQRRHPTNGNESLETGIYVETTSNVVFRRRRTLAALVALQLMNSFLLYLRRRGYEGTIGVGRYVVCLPISIFPLTKLLFLYGTADIYLM